MKKNLVKSASSLKLVSLIVIFLTCFTLPHMQAQSFTISPMKTTLKPEQNKSQQWFTVKAAGNKPVAVELSILKREVDINGQLFLSKDDTEDDFLIYPNKLILMPGDAQTANIQWLGEMPNNEVIYTLVAAQVPIEINKKENTTKEATFNVKVLIKYEGIIYLQPNGLKSEVIVEEATHKTDVHEKTSLEIVLYNRGTVRHMINKLKLNVTPLNKYGDIIGESIVYIPKMPKKVIKQSLYAKQRRRCLIPWPANIPVGPVRVSVVNR